MCQNLRRKSGPGMIITRPNSAQGENCVDLFITHSLIEIYILGPQLSSAPGITSFEPTLKRSAISLCCGIPSYQKRNSEKRADGGRITLNSTYIRE